MYVIGNFFIALAQILQVVFQIYLWVVIIRALISWVNPDPYNPIVQFLHRATDPLLDRIGRVIPPLGGIDLSPMILILAIMFLQSFVVKNLVMFGAHLTGGM